MYNNAMISSPVKQKLQVVLDALKVAKPYATGIDVTGEVQTFNWKSPPGFGWSKTSDLNVAISNSEKRLHVVVSTGTGDLYFYK